MTYPLTTAMLACRRSRVVRGFSFFGVSFVYVIFEDGTDIYWARSRVLEYLNSRHGEAAGATSSPRSVPTPPASAGSINTPSSAPTAPWPSCARNRTGTSASGSPRRKAWPRSQASAASCASTRSSSIRVKLQELRHASRRASSTPCAPATARRRRPRRRDGRDRVHGARPRLSHRHRRPRADRAQGRRADAGAAARRGAGRAGPRRAARPQPSSTARARRWAASSCSASAQNALDVIGNVKARLAGDRRRPARGRARSRRSTTAPS